MIEVNYSDSLKTKRLKLQKKILSRISQNLSIYLRQKFPQQTKLILDSDKFFSLSLSIIGKAKMKKLNLEQRNKNYATDVLSFPTIEGFQTFSKFKNDIIFDPSQSLGDIVICSDVCWKQAKEHNLSYEREAIHLICHGFLHLLGFDHEISVVEERKMQKEEDKLIKLFDDIS